MRPTSTRAVLLVGLGWLAVAVALGATGVVRALPPAAAPMVVFGLTAAVLAAAWLRPGFRAWLAAVEVRWLVGLHLTRTSRFIPLTDAYILHSGDPPFEHVVSVAIVSTAHIAKIVPLVTLA